jgi:hypothetical protein
MLVQVQQQMPDFCNCITSRYERVESVIGYMQVRFLSVVPFRGMTWTMSYEIDKIQVNFPRHYLPAIMRAVDEKRVKWKAVEDFCGVSVGAFEWYGIVYHMTEIREFVISVEYKSGVYTDEHMFDILKEKAMNT